MVLPINLDDDGYKFYKTLNEDIKLTSDEYGVWDMVFEETSNGKDLVNITGKDSLVNGCCIAIMTRYEELKDNPTYTGFGCRVHELIKSNRNSMTEYKIELFVTDTLEKIRRVKNVNEVLVMKSDTNDYIVHFNITCHDDSTVKGVVGL